MMLRAIDRRTHNQYAMEAGLHGLKVPFKYNQELLRQKAAAEDIEFDPENVQKALMEAQARVKARYV